VGNASNLTMASGNDRQFLYGYSTETGNVSRNWTYIVEAQGNETNQSTNGTNQQLSQNYTIVGLNLS
jgi:hypothetical protein